MNTDYSIPAIKKTESTNDRMQMSALTFEFKAATSNRILSTAEKLFSELQRSPFASQLGNLHENVHLTQPSLDDAISLDFEFEDICPIQFDAETNKILGDPGIHPLEETSEEYLDSREFNDALNFFSEPLFYQRPQFLLRDHSDSKITPQTLSHRHQKPRLSTFIKIFMVRHRLLNESSITICEHLQKKMLVPKAKLTPCHRLKITTTIYNAKDSRKQENLHWADLPDDKFNKKTLDLLLNIPPCTRTSASFSGTCLSSIQKLINSEITVSKITKKIFAEGGKTSLIEARPNAVQKGLEKGVKQLNVTENDWEMDLKSHNANEDVNVIIKEFSSLNILISIGQ